MRIVITIFYLLLAGCTTSPAELVGKPLNEAVSLYGQPVAAVDYEGARTFYFAKDRKTDEKLQRTKDLFNPDMPILNTDINYINENGCFYILNALWTHANGEWRIHSAAETVGCGGSRGN